MYKRLVVVLLIFGLIFMLNQFDAFGKITDSLIKTIKTAAKRVGNVFTREQDTADIQEEKMNQEFTVPGQIDDIAGIQKQAKEKNISEHLIKRLSKDKIENDVTAERKFDEPFTYPFPDEYSDRILPEQEIMEGEMETEESANWNEFMQYLLDGIYVSPYEEWFKQPDNEENEEYSPPQAEEYSLDELLQDIEREALLELRNFLLEELEAKE